MSLYEKIPTSTFFLGLPCLKILVANRILLAKFSIGCAFDIQGPTKMTAEGYCIVGDRLHTQYVFLACGLPNSYCKSVTVSL
jgi:hypothetical protein